jgi:SAM-dependent methyltransferase
VANGTLFSAALRVSPELRLSRWSELWRLVFWWRRLWEPEFSKRGVVEEEQATRTITQCPLCSSTALKTLPFEYWYQHEPFPGCRCSKCGLVFLSVQPDRETLGEMYGEQYFESDFRCGSAPASYFSTEEPFALEAASALKLIRELTGKSGGRLLEIGCAGGWLLKAAREAGWKVKGVEISKEATEFARTKLDLDVLCGSLSEATFPPQSFDVVYMADVLEHIPDPVGFAVELRRIVAPDGYVIVCGPTALNALWRRLGILVYGLFNKTRSIAAAPYHLFEYTPQTIKRLFESTGFDVIHLRKRKIPPGLRARTLEDLLVFAVELVNFPATLLFGLWSDRVVLCAKPRSQG